MMFDKIDMEFIEYVNTFYGSGIVTHHKGLDNEIAYEDVSIYGKEFFPSTGGVTKAEIMMATKIRMSMRYKDIPFEGDTTDREMVRDIIAEARETTAVSKD